MALDNIKMLYNTMNEDQQNEFVFALAKEFNVEFTTIKQKWFGRWDIPNKYRIHENVVAMMQNYINNQNTVAS